MVASSPSPRRRQPLVVEVTFCVQGVMTAPWGVPVVGCHRVMFFMMSCRRKPSISDRTRPSLIDPATRAVSLSCGMLSK